MSRASDTLRLAALGAILFAAFMRAMTAPPLTPFWDVDPMAAAVPETALLPSWALLLDALVLLGAGAAILGETRARRPIMWRSGLLLLPGVLVVLLHGLVRTPIGAAGLRGDFDSLATGSAWAAAMTGAWAIAHLARDPAFRRAAGLALLGFVALLAAVGAHEYFLEHARTVADFDNDPAAALRAQGLEPGSRGARIFERRLRQPEATAWFGLSNVYGSFAAAGLVGWSLIGLACARARRRLALVASTVAALACLGALAMSGSKGAIGAAIVAGAVAAPFTVPRLATRLRALGPALALGAVATPLLVVLARGIVGERIGELSLLFRWHYAVAATRIFGDHPLAGVGPGAFKAAYAQAKVPRNPEWVDSAHSLLLDWAATLGLLGLAWGALLILWVVLLGRALPEADPAPDPDHPPEHAGPPRAAALLAILGAIFFAWSLDRPVTGPGPLEMLVRALGAGAWVALLYLPLSVSRLALAGAGLTVAVHAQLEMTGVRTNSALPALLLIALGAAPVLASASPPAARPKAPGIAAAAIAAFLAATIVLAGVLPAARWQHHLRLAATAVQPGPSQRITLADVDDAVRHLQHADDLLPSRTQPLQHAARLRMVEADVLLRRADEPAARRAASDAARFAERLTDRYPGRAPIWSRLGAVERGRFELLRDRDALAASADAWARAAALDPTALTPAFRAWDAYRVLGRRAEAVRWARRTLELDEQLVLDPLVGLSESQRASIEGWLASLDGRSGSLGNGAGPAHE